MTQLIIVILAIVLGGLLVAGGVSYFDAGVGTRLRVSHGLSMQQEALSTGISTYMLANGGVAPSSLGRLAPYLVGGQAPRAPLGTETLEWRMEKPPVATGIEARRVLCLIGDPSGLDPDVAQGIVAFARDAARREPSGSVTFGLSCGVGATVPEEFALPSSATAVAVSFGGR